MPSRDRDAVLRDEEARDGAHAPRAGSLPVHQHSGLFHQQLGAHLLLLRDRQVSLTMLCTRLRRLAILAPRYLSPSREKGYVQY